MYFLSPDLQIKIIQKSAKPPNMQHHMLPTFSDTTVRRGKKGKKGKRSKRIATENSVFSLIFQDWAQMNAVAAYTISLPICEVRAQAMCVIYICVCLSFLCVSVPNIKCVGSSHEIYYIHTTCIFKKKKRLQKVKIYCTVKLAKIMTTVRKKIIRAKFGSGGRIL